MSSPKADAFTAQASQLAQQMGIQHVVIAIVEPETGETRVVASPGAMDATRDKLVEKLDVASGGETPLAGYDNNFGV